MKTSTKTIHGKGITHVGHHLHIHKHLDVKSKQQIQSGDLNENKYKKRFTGNRIKHVGHHPHSYDSHVAINCSTDSVYPLCINMLCVC